MIIFTKQSKTTFVRHANQLEQLYVNCFVTGESGWGLAQDEVRDYIQRFAPDTPITPKGSPVGVVICAMDEDRVVGALLSAPLSFDPEMPRTVIAEFGPATALYIAEMMVDEQYRGRGIGKQLLQAFTQERTPGVNAAVIRVWNKNIPAQNLYRNAGFTPVAAIVQKKNDLDSGAIFDMEKTYLVKQYSF